MLFRQYVCAVFECPFTFGLHAYQQRRIHIHARSLLCSCSGLKNESVLVGECLISICTCTIRINTTKKQHKFLNYALWIDLVLPPFDIYCLTPGQKLHMLKKMEHNVLLLFNGTKRSNFTCTREKVICVSKSVSEWATRLSRHSFIRLRRLRFCFDLKGIIYESVYTVFYLR